MEGISKHNELKGLWTKYNEVRLSGAKKKANELLKYFIGLLKKQDKGTIKAFADQICHDVLDSSSIIENNGSVVSGQTIRIQHPLFKEIIVPVLAEQYEKDSAIHIKWIAQLEQFFYSDNKSTIDFCGYPHFLDHLSLSLRG